MAFNLFPYSNFHKLNLDWVIKTIREAKEAMDQAAETVTSYESRLAAVESSVSSLSTSLQLLQGVVSAHTLRLDQAQSDIQALRTSTAQDLAVVTNKMALFESDNKSGPESNWTNGSYLGNANGLPITNALFCHSGMIPVNPGDQVRLYSNYNGFGLKEMQTICAYDSEQNFIFKPDTVSYRKQIYTVEEDTAYIIVSGRVATQRMVTINKTVTAFQEYFPSYYIATPDFLPASALSGTTLKDLENQFACALPKGKFRQTVGIAEKWYKQNMVTPPTERVEVNAGYSTTISENDGYTFNNMSASSGNNGYVWYIFDDLFNKIYDYNYGTGYGAPMVRQAEALNNCSLLAIGDSTIDSDHLTGKLLEYFTQKNKTITLLGTLGSSSQPLNKNEGRAGWTTQDYMTNSTKNGYTNPFYNPATESFDFAYYMNNQNYSSVNFVVIQLGINDLYPSTPRMPAEPNYNNIFSNIQAMIDSILEFDNSIKVIINLPTPPNSDQTEHRIPMFLYQHYVIRFNEVALSKASSYSQNNVRVSYCHLILDPANDISDNVHPTTAGYEKMAMEVVNQINCWQNNV